MGKKGYVLFIIALLILTGICAIDAYYIYTINKKQPVLIEGQKKNESRLNVLERLILSTPMDAKRIEASEQRIVNLENQLRMMMGPPPEDFSKTYDIEIGHSLIRGKNDAPVTIVEFVDFQCPYCARFHSAIKDVLKAYPDKVRYILKNYPLPFHPQAKSAAKAAFAAKEQAKYWEMVDALIENGNGELNEEKFKELAKNIGLNVKKFMKDYQGKNAAWEDYIAKDLELGSRIDVQGTPTFFLNGKKTRARDFNGFKNEIDQILNSVQ